MPSDHNTLRQPHATRFEARFGVEAIKDVEDWLSGKDLPAHSNNHISTISPTMDSSPSVGPGWRQPRFETGPVYEKLLAKERMLPPKLGGRSKNEQLGSIAMSWGEVIPGDTEEEKKGMFELLEDPPSRSTSPYRMHDTAPDSELQRATKEAWLRARKGTQLDRKLEENKVENPVLSKQSLRASSHSARPRNSTSHHFAASNVTSRTVTHPGHRTKEKNTTSAHISKALAKVS